VVLVRDGAARDRLPPVLKDSALVLTIAEAKGLEFDDVFVFNFFADSPAGDREWRTMYGKMGSMGCNMDGISYSTTGVKKREQAFDATEHSILLAELKHLYTAITRARCRVIVYDDDREKRAPMFELMERAGLMEVTSVNEEDTPGGFATQSSVAEWYEQGVVFEENKNFKQAAHCFGQAQDAEMQQKMLGYDARRNAQRSPTAEERQALMFDAGFHLVQAGEDGAVEALECFDLANEADIAAGLREKLGLC